MLFPNHIPFMERQIGRVEHTILIWLLGIDSQLLIWVPSLHFKFPFLPTSLSHHFHYIDWCHFFCFIYLFCDSCNGHHPKYNAEHLFTRHLVGLFSSSLPPCPISMSLVLYHTSISIFFLSDQVLILFINLLVKTHEVVVGVKVGERGNHKFI